MMRKIRFYKRLLIEIVETLCSICLYLELDARHTHNSYGDLYMRDHFVELKKFSDEMRGRNKR